MPSLHQLTGTDGNGVPRTIRITKKTLLKVESHLLYGAVIIINTNRHFTGMRAGYQAVIKIAQTNSAKGAHIPKHIVWACYLKK